MKYCELLTDIRNRDRYDVQKLSNGAIYWRAENVTMSDILDYIAVVALMELNISAEEWMEE